MIAPRATCRPLVALSLLLVANAVPALALEEGDAERSEVEELPAKDGEPEFTGELRNPYATPKDLRERWLPSVSLGVEVYEERGTGTLVATGLAPAGVGGEIESFDSRNLTALRLLGELSTPALFDEPVDVGLFELAPTVRAHLYAGTQIYPSRAFQSRITGRAGGLEGAVSAYLASRARNPSRPAQDPEDFSGHGAAFESGSTNETWIVGLGGSYRHEYDSFDLKLRASLEYFGERVETEMSVRALLEPSPDLFEFINADLSTTRTYHNLGPSLELETIVKRAGSLGLSIFLQARYLWNVGDRNLTLADPRGVVNATYRRPGARLRGGAGLRVHWQGL